MSPHYGENFRVQDDYSARIRALRIAHELTQMRLADLLGVAFATVNRWENGQSKPSPMAWQQILRIERFGMDAFQETREEKPMVRETGPTYNPSGVMLPDFTTAPEVVRIIAEAHRLTYGHLFNPAFATEISRIDPLPHQRIAVYDHMLKQTRLRFLLADDAGAGKTIMAGLYIREMLARRLIRRVMIVPPAGLVGNWYREMHSLFSLPFRIISGTDAKTDNPFKNAGSDLLIVSVDTLAGEKMFSRLQESATEPYDLVIFDEAHKLSARRDPDGTFRATDRYRLAESLAGVLTDDSRWKLDWPARHLLLLTATPHMGKDFPFFCLWRLLEPDVISTYSAFQSFPQESRARYFIRRTKEEMVRYDNSRIYPMRISDTLSYELSQGEISEQKLYNETTSYIQTYYNKARLLNRTAAHFAMSIFQRRLASSTYALLRSLERRMKKLSGFIEAVQSGEISEDKLVAIQRRLDDVQDVYYSKTADEESVEEGAEEHEIADDQVLGGTVAATLAELEVERRKVEELVNLAQQVYELGHESKFDKLRDILADSKYHNEKIIIFTEHRDTLTFLVRRLEGLGYSGHIAQIHGGMDYNERDEQVEFFRKPIEEGGARCLIATDAAGEGINLQFCWLMVNYDIPWNPARLEQRMGRIHRYGQKHDPVVIVNLIAGKTREGRVLKTLLDKLEKIRKQLRSDKVFDVIGRVFEDISIRQYMEMATSEEGASEAQKAIEGHLTETQIKAVEEREKLIFGAGGEVAQELPRLRDDLEREIHRRLLPGYIQRFVEKAAPMDGIEIEGTTDHVFSFRPSKPHSMDHLWHVFETYPQEVQNRLTISKPREFKDAIFFHPGEAIFDTFAEHVSSTFANDALKGSVFIDPSAAVPYFLHFAIVRIRRKADSAIPAFAHEELVECRLIGLRQKQADKVEECPVEYLEILRNGEGLPPSHVRFAASVKDAIQQVRIYADITVAKGMADKRRADMLAALPERESFIRRGYDFQEAELAERRIAVSEKARSGDSRAKQELTLIKERQRQIASLRNQTLRVLATEPNLIEPFDVTFVAHALVVPSSTPEDQKAQDALVEQIAMKVAVAYEESQNATVKDVSTPALARQAGLPDWPGFDLLSRRADGITRSIEVKGRATVGDIEVSENEWAKACNLRDCYWLYAAYNCATASPRLIRVKDPFGNLLAKAKGSVLVSQVQIVEAGEA